MNTKNIGEDSQKDSKGKKILTTAGATVVGAAAGAGADRLMHNDNSDEPGEITEEEQKAETEATAQEQGSTGQTTANNAAAHHTSHHGATAHTVQTGSQTEGTTSHAVQEEGQHTEATTDQTAEASTESTDNEHVEAEAVAVAERLVGDDEEPTEEGEVLELNDEAPTVLYTEDGTEIPVEERVSPIVDDTLAEIPEDESIPDDLFEEDGGTLSYTEEGNEVADLGAETEADIEADIMEI